jgi:hypothetical protein
MGGWYTVGLFCGLGVALGVLLAAVLAPSRAGLAAALAVGAGGGALLGALVEAWPEAVGGGVGGALGALGAGPVARATLARGGTRAGTAAWFAGGAVILAALAFVPIVGYLEAVAVPALAARLRRRSGRTYAGLRILARD